MGSQREGATDENGARLLDYTLTVILCSPQAVDFIDIEMGQQARTKAIMESAINLTHEEVKIARTKFQQIDKDRRGARVRSIDLIEAHQQQA